MTKPLSAAALAPFAGLAFILSAACLPLAANAQTDDFINQELLELPQQMLLAEPFSGQWDTVTGGSHYLMTIDQQGKGVKGSYDPNGGVITDGYVGLAESGMPAMVIWWKESSGSSGTAVFVMDEGGNSFKGVYQTPYEPTQHKWNGTRVGSVATKPEEPSAPAAAAGFLLTCRAGHGMNGKVADDGSLRLEFVRAKSGSDERPPKPGQCAWFDRGFSKGEPGSLFVPADMARLDDLVESVNSGGSFQVHVFNNNQGAMVVTSIDETEF